MIQQIKKKGPAIFAISLFTLIAVVLLLLFLFFRKGFSFALLALLPISELRGAIPLGVLSYKWEIWAVYPSAVFLNALVAPLLFIFLDYIHPLLYRWSLYRKLFDRFIAKARVKLEKKVNQYGLWGIMLFIGIPLPITGAYTGIAGAWILGLDRKKSMIAALGGVMLSGLIVSAVVLTLASPNVSQGLKHFLEIFIKDSPKV